MEPLLLAILLFLGANVLYAVSREGFWDTRITNEILLAAVFLCAAAFIFLFFPPFSSGLNISAAIITALIGALSLMWIAVVKDFCLSAFTIGLFGLGLCVTNVFGLLGEPSIVFAAITFLTGAIFFGAFLKGMFGKH